MSALYAVLTILAVFGIWAVIVWFIIRADDRAQRAHDAWMNRPDQVWNRWKRDADERL